MCRIAAIISNNINTLDSRINAMSNVMYRGGPDDFGTLVNSDFGYALGHRRLSIIDLSPTGHQPMIDKENKIEITFNGEIYNYKELKNELINKGHQFFTESDTEVLINGYKEWGYNFLEKLKGMFAFILIDKNKNLLFAARDHAGIKPLYIGKKNNDIYFSSEIKGFKAIDADWEENNNWKIWFLTYGFLPEPITTLKNVKPVPRGSYLTIDLSTKEEKLNTFYKYHYNENVIDYKQAVEITRDLIEKSVTRHLVADVPVGVFLSGGIDSSILAIITQQQKKSPIETISIYFDDEKFSEKEYQELIIKQTGVKHHLYKISKEEFLNSWNEIYESLDQPSTDAINTHFICKYAKQNGLKVVLSGVGGDEIFGGYPSIKRVNNFNNYSRLAIINKFLPNILFGSYPNKKIDYLNKKINASEYLLYRGLFTPKDVAKILNINTNDVWKELATFTYQENIEKLSPQNRATYYETAIYMQSQLLKDSDTQSMWHSLELRVPYLDKDLMNFVNNLHPSVKFPKGKTKPLLVDAFIDVLPKQIWSRTKQGFTFPLETWFKSMSVFKNEYLIPKFIYKTFSKKIDTYSRVWAIYLYKIDKVKILNQNINNFSFKPNTLFTYLSAFKDSGGVQKVNKTILKSLEFNESNDVEAWGVYDEFIDSKYFPAYAYKGFKGNRVYYFYNVLRNSFKWKHIIVGHINLASVIRLVKFINPKIKLTLVVHGIDVWDKQTNSKKWLLHNADKIISVSNYTKQQLVDINFINAEKIKVLPNCIDPFFEKSIITNINQSRDYLLERYKISDNQKIILTVSRIKSTEKYKGYDKVIEALSRIKENTKIEFIYILCGSYDELEFLRVKKIIADSNLENNVILTGFVPDVELVDHYKLADVFIMPSKKEGFGIVFIEAAACGTRVIAGNSDGSVEALLNGEIGQLVDPDSADEIYNLLLENLTSNNINKEKLQEKVMENYNFKLYKEKLNKLLFN